MGGSQQHIGILAVLQPEQPITVFRPAVSHLVGFAWQQRRKLNFLGTNGLHFLANNTLNVAQNFQAQRQPRVHTWRHATDISGADKELVAGNLSVGWVLTQGTQKERGHTGNHEK